ncbi:MAG: HEPN domain-containing protein [Chloroflexi bacterium]|nr:HEPN domain-containing protein [Chloroflexota bacterium]
MAPKVRERKTRKDTKRASGYRYGLTPRQWRTVQRVRARLRSILPNGELKSLILYGSRVYGKPRPESDIDLFLIYDDVTPEQEKSIEELTVDGEFPLVHLFEYRADKLATEIETNPLVYNVAHHGILLEGAPVPKLDIDRHHVAEVNIIAAKERLEAARVLLSVNLYPDSISRSYYAVLCAADAALATKGFVAKSHEGTNNLFGYHFFRKGLVDAKFKGLIGRAAKARLKADYYKEVIFNREDAEYWFGRAQEFVTAIESAIPQWLGEEG